MSDSVFMYADIETIDILNKDIPKVLLFGGYLGFNNFGDILQLKGAIKYHNDSTLLEPVVVCQVGSVPDRDYLSRLREWFGVKAFIFIQDQPVNLALLDLRLIDKSLPIDHLHVYGGGFLNRMWGDYCLRLIEGLIRNFRVVNYVISGQQIDAAIASRLKVHFNKYQPQLIGARDFESQRILNSIGFNCEYSFDDASNIIKSWGHRKPEIINRGAEASLFIHLNTSKYVWNNSETYKNELDRIAVILKELASKFSTLEPVFLNAYSEYRVEVKDTIATIINMETALPFLDYRVIDLAHIALLHNPYRTDIDYNLKLFGNGIAISSSYHTALFCNMLDIPCYLISGNEYYKQKREGFGENRTLDQFLENPSVLSYSRLMELRKDWLDKLTTLFQNIDRNCDKSTITINYNNIEFASAPFHFKEASVNDKDNDDLKRRVIELVSVLEGQKANIDNLGANLDKANRELNDLRSSLSWRATSFFREILDFLKK